MRARRSLGCLYFDEQVEQAQENSDSFRGGGRGCADIVRFPLEASIERHSYVFGCLV